jgi:hypothetical protein
LSKRVNCLISKTIESDWKVSLDVLADRIVAKWPGARTEKGLDPRANQVLSWKYRAQFGPVDGALSWERDCIYLDGDVCDCADFAVWFRKTDLATEGLIFYDEGCTAHVSLDGAIDARDIADAFLGSAIIDPP